MENLTIDHAEYKRYLEMYQSGLGDQEKIKNHLLKMCQRFSQAYQQWEVYTQQWYLEKSDSRYFKNREFYSWYERRKKRNRFQSYDIRRRRDIFLIPLAFELDDGCSVSCPFCCFAAGKLKKVFRFTEENAQLWREILEICREIIGESASLSLCYYATEPFDNPDYEKWIRIYKEIMGCFPQTTTAVADRDIDRTKGFLRMIPEEDKERCAVRFSVTSAEQFDKLIREFTALDLKNIPLLLNNPESSNAYSKAGRAMALEEKLSDKRFNENMSISCVCGFIVNMVRGTITLTAPHRPDSAHPLGTEVLCEESFQTSRQFREKILNMVRNYMKIKISGDKSYRLCDYIDMQYDGVILTVRGDRISRKLTMTKSEYDCLENILKKRENFGKSKEKYLASEYESARFEEKFKIFYDSGYIDEIC